MNAYARPLPCAPAYFEAMFADSEDPWKFATRWYEKRKRALTVAALPCAHYDHAYEPGCATGELSAALAPLCGRLLVSDGIAKAAALARRRLVSHDNVEVRQMWVPDQWPDEQFDLIVLSEFLFYLTPEKILDLAEKVGQSLKPEGTVLACHWRVPFSDCVTTGDAAHDILQTSLRLPHLTALTEKEFRIDVWSAGKSAAAADKLV